MLSPVLGSGTFIHLGSHIQQKQRGGGGGGEIVLFFQRIILIFTKKLSLSN
jgi:hypothetical protein